MKCFEINLLLIDHASKTMKDLRQYFQQEKGSYQAIQDTLAWVHLVVKGLRNENPDFVIERLIIWSWNITTPEPNGEINTKKSNKRVLNWSFEKGILDMQTDFGNKQQRRIMAACRFLNKYRHVRAEVLIEEIPGTLAEDVTCIAI